MKSHIAFKMLLGVIFLAGCGRIEMPDASQGAATPYINLFVKEALARGRDMRHARQIDVSFSTKLKDGQDAVCLTPFMGGRRIIFSEIEWSAADEYRRRAVVFHELGHCVLNQSHRTDGLSIMAPAALSGPMIEAHQAELLDELFSHN